MYSGHKEPGDWRPLPFIQLVNSSTFTNQEPTEGTDFPKMSRPLYCGDRQVSAVLLDVTGVLYESGDGGGTVIKGSPEAVEKYQNIKLS